MSEAFIGDIRLFGFDYPPRGWAFCDGALLPISQFPALFSIIGTMYGGNGSTTFALPDLRGRAPVHVGSGITWGQSGGEEMHTLTVNEMPAHNHIALGSGQTAISSNPIGNVWAPPANNVGSFAPKSDTLMSPNALSQAGGSQGHNNMQPYLAMNYCICMDGIFPSRN